MDFYFNLIKNILKLLFLLWSSCYIQVCCLISRYLGIFQLSFFYNFYFNPIVVWEHTLYAWYHLNLDVIYNTDCGPAFWLFQVRLWNYILLLEKKVLYMSIRSCWFIVLFNQLYSYWLPPAWYNNYWKRYVDLSISLSVLLVFVSCVLKVFGNGVFQISPSTPLWHWCHSFYLSIVYNHPIHCYYYYFKCFRAIKSRKK